MGGQKHPFDLASAKAEWAVAHPALKAVTALLTKDFDL